MTVADLRRGVPADKDLNRSRFAQRIVEKEASEVKLGVTRRTQLLGAGAEHPI